LRILRISFHPEALESVGVNYFCVCVRGMPYRAEFPWISNRWAPAANHGPAIGGPGQPIRDRQQVGPCSQSGTSSRWAMAANKGPATGGPRQPIKDQQQVGLGSQSGTPRRAAPPIPANAAAWWRRIKILACMGGVTT
jgi:hypothetical protein